MLPKKNRAGRKTVKKIFKDGVFVGSSNLNLKYVLENNTTPPQISFIISKTVEKKAVRRNYLRRRGYIILKNYLNRIPNGFFGLFIFNKIKPIHSAFNIEDEIKTIFNKLKFIKKD